MDIKIIQFIKRLFYVNLQRIYHFIERLIEDPGINEEPSWVYDGKNDLESSIWLMPPLYYRVWLYLKYNASYEPGKVPISGTGELEVMPGQHLTSIRNIAKGVSWYEGLKLKEPNPKTIKAILNWLMTQGMIQIKNGMGNRQYTLITLVNSSFIPIKNTNRVTANNGVKKHGFDNRKDINIPGVDKGILQTIEKSNVPESLKDTFLQAYIGFVKKNSG